MISQLNDVKPREGEIRINVFDPHLKKPSEIVFPIKYFKSTKNQILYIYVTQIKEYYEENRNDMIHIWYGDL